MCFVKFCQIFRKQELLKDSHEVTIEEQMSIFLMTAGHKETECYKNSFNILVKQLVGTSTTS